MIIPPSYPHLQTFVAAAYLAEFSLDLIFIDVLKNLSVHVCPVCAVVSNFTRRTRLTGPTPGGEWLLGFFGIKTGLISLLINMKVACECGSGLIRPARVFTVCSLRR